MLWHENIPVVQVQDAERKTTTIKIIAGSYENTSAPNPNPDSWAADLNKEVHIWILALDPYASFILPATAPEINRSLYFFQGDQLNAEGFEIPPMQRLIANASEKLTLKNGSKQAKMLLLQQRPIREHVFKQGSFVANSREEINTAFSRFRESEFGGWPWPTHEHTRSQSGSFCYFPRW